MDYRKLCIDLFGTDDAEKLKEIAEQLNKKNPRNAGRKKLLSDNEQKQLKDRYSEGATLKELAAEYGTSRQVIGRYLNTPMHPGCTLRIYYMHKHRPCTVIDVDFMREKVYIDNYTGNIWNMAFGNTISPTWEDFQFFLRERCFPETRIDANRILKALGLNHYDPLAIIEKTKGKIAEDNMWLKLRYKEITEG